MKKKTLWLAGLTVMVAALATQSCSNDEPDYSLSYPTALVTVKPNVNNTSFSMQLDDSTVLHPVNRKTPPFGTKEVRALVNYTVVDRPTLGKGINVNVNWIDSIRTKNMAPFLNEKKNVETYGDDPVEIVDDWVTIAEDGYLTLRFRTRWSHGITHFVNLVQVPNLVDNYIVRFYHNAQKDTNGRVGDGIVAFRLNNLPDTQGKTVWLTLEWNSYRGPKTVKFKYCTRKNTLTRGTNSAAMTAPVQITRID